MFLKRVFLLLSCFLLVLNAANIRSAYACGHDGFYVGFGYNQLFMYSPQTRYGSSEGTRISFSPGFGGNVLLGYDFCGSRWGIQMPLEVTRIKLNHYEWLTQLGSTFEGVLHLVEWANGLDIHMLFGTGWSYISEGRVENRTATGGITADLGPGLSYYFTRSDKLSASLTLEVPVRFIYYFGNHLSQNGTAIFAVPIRASVQLGF